MLSNRLLWLVIAVGAAAGAITPLPVYGQAKGPDAVASTQLANELFDSAGYWFSGRIAVWPIDGNTMPAIGLPEQPSLMIADEVRAAVQRVGLQRGYKFVERAAISKVFAEQQFSQGRTDKEFAQLARASGADAVALTNILRKDSGAAIVSVRLVMATGDKEGRVIAATGVHDFHLMTAEKFLGPGPNPNLDYSGLKPVPQVQYLPPAQQRIIEHRTIVEHHYDYADPPEPSDQRDDNRTWVIHHDNGTDDMADRVGGMTVIHRANGHDDIIDNDE